MTFGFFNSKERSIATALTVVLALCILMLYAGAQGKQNTSDKPRAAKAPEEKSKPTPRSPDGHPDLTGFWGHLFSNFAVAKTGDSTRAGWAVEHRLENDPDEVAARVSQFVGPQAGQNKRKDNYTKNPDSMPPYKPELRAKVFDLMDHQSQNDPVFYCRPPGIPRVGTPTEIIQSRGKVVLFYELIKGGNWFRMIPTDGRSHKKDADSSYFGDSVGHWEGDTLVVDTVNFNDDTWLGSDGWIHSTKMHVIERLKRDGDVLSYQLTVEDPDVFTKPWVKPAQMLKLNTGPDAEMFEQGPCSEQDSGHLVNNDHN